MGIIPFDCNFQRRAAPRKFDDKMMINEKDDATGPYLCGFVVDEMLRVPLSL